MPSISTRLIHEEFHNEYSVCRLAQTLHQWVAGDSDELWCEFLMARGVLDRQAFEPRNQRMARDYRAARVSAQDFCDFYIATLAGHSAQEWLPLRQEFADTLIVPRFSPAAIALVEQHRAAGDLLVLTTATNRFLSEPAAAYLGIHNLVATECEFDEQGRFNGRSRGLGRKGALARTQSRGPSLLYSTPPVLRLALSLVRFEWRAIATAARGGGRGVSRKRMAFPWPAPWSGFWRAGIPR